MIGKWKEGLKNAGLQLQFNLFYIGMLMFLVPAITVFCYWQSQKILCEVVTSDIRNLVEKSNQIADSKLQLAKQYTFYFLADKDAQRLLREAEGCQDFSRLYFLDGELKKIADRYFLSSPDIYSVNIVTDHYTFGIEFSQNYIPAGAFKDSLVYQIGMKSRERLAWVPTYKFFQMYNQPELERVTGIDYYYMFSMVRNLESLLREGRPDKERDGEGFQILTINFVDSFWDDVFLSIPEYQNVQHMVLDERGAVITHSDKGRIGEVLEEGWVQEIAREKSGSRFVELDGKRVMMSYGKSSVTGWMSVFAMEEKELWALHFSQLQKSSLLIFGLLLISVAAFSWVIRGWVVRPVIRLTGEVEKVEKDPEYQIPERGSREFRGLISAYNHMKTRVRQLTRQNCEMESLYQASKLREINLQLNPHFIYNVLNMLNLELIRDGEFEYSELVDDVIYMMRYILDSDNIAETFGIDLKYTLHYIDVVNRRYDGIYQLEVAVEPDLYETKVPKFMLQPIVENVFKHAFAREGEKERKIRISCYRREGMRYFTVEDNGSGMDEKLMEQISRGEECSVGLRNTRERVEHLYGLQALLYAEASPMGGAKVCIVLPEGG